mmetsp:Transcript_96898/g.235560  ORF Transcript_96898/g.235560 Transcript_96898/m.235560 type:complete len:246 (-) Transcript_96898:159-896(-)
MVVKSMSFLMSKAAAIAFCTMRPETTERQPKAASRLSRTLPVKNRGSFLMSMESARTSFASWRYEVRVPSLGSTNCCCCSCCSCCCCWRRASCCMIASRSATLRSSSFRRVSVTPCCRARSCSSSCRFSSSSCSLGLLTTAGPTMLSACRGKVQPSGWGAGSRPCGAPGACHGTVRPSGGGARSRPCGVPCASSSTTLKLTTSPTAKPASSSRCTKTSHPKRMRASEQAMKPKPLLALKDLTKPR